MTRTEAIDLMRKIITSHEKMKEINIEKGGQVPEKFIDERIEALKIALHSLEVDEKYGLLYEETTNDKEQDNRDI